MPRGLAIFDFDCTLTKFHVWGRFRKAPLPEVLIDADTFVDLPAFYDESGEYDILLLKAEYLIDLARKGGRLKRRQDMPPEAFWTAADLRRLVEKLGTRYALLFVALSYRWLTKDHPDPEGFHLAIASRMTRCARLHSCGRSARITSSSTLGDLGRSSSAT